MEFAALKRLLPASGEHWSKLVSSGHSRQTFCEPTPDGFRAARGRFLVAFRQHLARILGAPPSRPRQVAAQKSFPKVVSRTRTHLRCRGDHGVRTYLAAQVGRVEP